MEAKKQCPAEKSDQQHSNNEYEQTMTLAKTMIIFYCLIDVAYHLCVCLVVDASWPRRTAPSPSPLPLSPPSLSFEFQNMCLFWGWSAAKWTKKEQKRK